jgi:hypothetical protein
LSKSERGEAGDGFMTSELDPAPGERTVFDSWRSIGISLYMALVGANLGYDGVFIMCAAASLTAMIIYGLMYLRLRRIEPALAGAS